MATPAAIAKRVHPSQVATVEFIKENATDERRGIIELLTYGVVPGPFGQGGRVEYDALIIEEIAGLCEIIKSQGERIAELEKATATKKKT
jgi:hypothetical protein